MEEVTFRRRVYTLLVPEGQRQRPGDGGENGRRREEQDRVTFALHLGPTAAHLERAPGIYSPGG